MSEKITLTPAEIRRRGFRLFRECWKPMLLTLLLTNVLSVVAYFVLQPVPYAEGTAVPLDSLAVNQQGEISKANLIVGLVLTFMEGFVVQPILMQGLFRALLSHHRGSGCTARAYLHGMKRWKTAIALDFWVVLRVMGYLVLGGIGVWLLCFIPILGPIGASIGYAVLTYWAGMRYFDARLHLADDSDNQLNAFDCIHYSIGDAEMYSISGLFKTLWPTYLPALVGNLLTEFLPETLLVSGIHTLLSELSTMMQTACCTAIYLYLRSEYQAVKDAEAARLSEGRARARALAAKDDAGK